MSKYFNAAALALVIAAGTVSPVWAHHSGAGVDMSRTLKADATIKEFHFGAPHSAGVFIIKDAKGQAQTLTITGGSPSVFTRQGFGPKDLKKGTPVEVSWHPAKTNDLGGLLISLKFTDGRTFGDDLSAYTSGASAPTARPPVVN
jgi:hypothetical protein